MNSPYFGSHVLLLVSGEVETHSPPRPQTGAEGGNEGGRWTNSPTGGRMIDEQSTRAGKFPCWFLLDRSIISHYFLSSLFFSSFFPSFPGLSAPFLSVGSPKDIVIHEGTGGETEGDTVAPSPSLEDAGGSRVSVFLLDRSFWWLSSYGVANSKGRNGSSYLSV